MTNSVISPFQQFRDSNGVPRAGGFVTFFVNTTTTPGTVYSDEGLSVAQNNPYTLNAAGEIIGDCKYEGLRTLQITNSDGSDIETLDDVITTNATETLRTDLADNTDVTKGVALVAGSFMDSVNTVISTTTYTVVVADRGTLIEQTSAESTTVTLLPAATASEGFTVAFRNNSTVGVWTIVGDSGEAINEGTQVILAPGEWCVLVSDGVSSWRSLISHEPYLKAVTAITSNHIVDAADKGLIFNASGTISVTTPLPSVVKEGFSFTVRNSGSSIITIFTSGAETINGASSIELDASRWATVVCDGTNWTAISGTSATETAVTVVQVVNVRDGVMATTASLVPFDNTIPQITEGAEFMTLDITPINSSNLLKIEISAHITTNATVLGLNGWAMSLFQSVPSGNNDALAVIDGAASTSGILSASVATIIYWMTAGTTSLMTFKIRAGGSATGDTVTFNGWDGVAFYGGKFASSMTITEYTT